MIVYTIGVIVIATVLAVGVFWLLSNVTFKRNTNVIDKVDTKDLPDA